MRELNKLNASSINAEIKKKIEENVKLGKAPNAPFTLADGGGLILQVPPSGAKRWRYRYRYKGTANMLSLGTFPDVSLKAARAKHKQLRADLANGIDVGEQRRADREAQDNSFQRIANEYLESLTIKPETVEAKRRKLELDVFPAIGKRPVTEISYKMLDRIMKRIRDRGALDVAARVRRLMSEVFCHAIQTGRADNDPAAALVTKSPKPKHRARITDPKKLGGLLRAIDGFEGSSVVRSALAFLPLVFVRPGELRNAEWSEIDFEQKIWRIPAERMKMGRDHIIPLSVQAIAILREIHDLTGDCKLVFPGVRVSTRPMSENTLNAALRRMGFTKEEMTSHGFRGTASTILHEQGYKPEWVEAQLAHSKKDKVAAAYNAAEYIKERTKMMQEWSDYLDALKSGATVSNIGIAANG